MKLVLVTPRVSEKAYRLVSSQNTYVFDVPMSANKNEIKAAVESQFDGTKVGGGETLVLREMVSMHLQVRGAP